MKGFLVSTLIGGVAASDEMTSKFMKYLSQQNKSYDSVEEFELRFDSFAKTEKFI